MQWVNGVNTIPQGMTASLQSMNAIVQWGEHNSAGYECNSAGYECNSAGYDCKPTEYECNGSMG